MLLPEATTSLDVPLEVVVGVGAVLAGQGAGESLLSVLVQPHVPLTVELSLGEVSSEGDSANRALFHIRLCLLRLIIILIGSNTTTEIYLLGCTVNHIALSTDHISFPANSLNSSNVRINNLALYVEDLLCEALITPSTC